MRARFGTEHYYRDLHYKLQTLKQENKSVDEYRNEMELYLLRVNIEEDKDATIPRLMSGLNRYLAYNLTGS